MATANATPVKGRISEDGRWVYCRYFRHWRTGKLVCPKRAKFFRFRRKR